MSNFPLVSVIVPVYGVERYVERCVRSIFFQTYDYLEIIFIDDCSPDSSVAIIERILREYPNRKEHTRIIHHDRNRGVGSARLTGLKVATGSYILYIDSDDYLDNDMIECLVDTAEKEDADISICDFMVELSGRSRHLYVNPSLYPKECMCQVLKGQVHSSLWNKLIRRSLFFDNRVFFIDGLNHQEDLTVMFRLMFYANKIAYISRPFYHYIMGNEGSYTSVKMNPSKLSDSIKRLRLMDEFCHENAPLSPHIVEAFRFNKAQTYSGVALYGDFQQLRSFRDLFGAIKLRDILLHPSMSSPVRLAGLFLKLKLIPLLKGLRWAQKIKHKCH